MIQLNLDLVPMFIMSNFGFNYVILANFIQGDIHRTKKVDKLDLKIKIQW